jgi:hypothetical protein
MEKIRPYLNSEYGTLLAVVMVAISLVLRAMGILALVVAFWSGFAFCLGLEGFAIYYFLAKAEAKTEEKLEAYVKDSKHCCLWASEFRSPFSHFFVFLFSFYHNIIIDIY